MTAYQPDAFQEDAFQAQVDSGSITQTVPAFTQALTGAEEVLLDELPGEVLGRYFRFRVPEIRFIRTARIHQTAPAFTQSLTAQVTDDELVLLLI